ncbi:hypothetical protein LSTR_LSTR011156 [Laodelphax striatellus]|uniref:Ankyrin repeat and SOCS box protein 17 n=1 Tax=Laodelphax striatellus TaxID=195883 RepID=A0A482XUV4_LAOST|nr:hypothetical protein LSTR_LSTR011156 [Laodelphax striatellus]
MESIIDCYFDNIFTQMDRGCLIPRYKRRQVVDYFSTVIRACSTENYEENCKKAVEAIIRFHKKTKDNNGSVCLLGKYHNVLYVALKLCFDWRLSDHKTVTTVLIDIFSCEKTFERLMIGAIFGTRVTHLISGWKSDFQTRDECLQAVEYFLEHTARSQLKFEIGGRFKTMADITMPSYGFSTPAKVCIQAGKFDFLKVLLRYGAEPVVVTNHNQCPLHLLLLRLHTLAESANPDEWKSFLFPPFQGFVLSEDVPEGVSRNQELSLEETSRMNHDPVSKHYENCESYVKFVPKKLCNNDKSDKSPETFENNQELTPKDSSSSGEPEIYCEFVSEACPKTSNVNNCESDLDEARSYSRSIPDEPKITEISQVYVPDEPKSTENHGESVSLQPRNLYTNQENIPDELKNPGGNVESVPQQPKTYEIDEKYVPDEPKTPGNDRKSFPQQPKPSKPRTPVTAEPSTPKNSLDPIPQQQKTVQNNEPVPNVFKSSIFPEDLIKCLQVFMSVIPQVPHTIFDNENEPTSLHPAVFSVVPWDRSGWTTASLKHLCRCEIRKRLVLNGCLPYGIYELKLPTQLQRYVDMGD